MPGSKKLVMAGVLGSLLFGCATTVIRESRVATGRVTDESGQPVRSEEHTSELQSR